MTRQFTQKHYLATADAVVRSLNQTRVCYHAGPCDAEDVCARRERQNGIRVLRQQLEDAFSEDSEKFDAQKFSQYIYARTGIK